MVLSAFEENSSSSKFKSSWEWNCCFSSTGPIEESTCSWKETGLREFMKRATILQFSSLLWFLTTKVAWDEGCFKWKSLHRVFPDWLAFSQVRFCQPDYLLLVALDCDTSTRFQKHLIKDAVLIPSSAQHCFRSEAIWFSGRCWRFNGLDHRFISFQILKI